MPVVLGENGGRGGQGQRGVLEYSVGLGADEDHVTTVRLCGSKLCSTGEGEKISGLSITVFHGSLRAFLSVESMSVCVPVCVCVCVTTSYKSFKILLTHSKNQNQVFEPHAATFFFFLGLIKNNYSAVFPECEERPYFRAVTSCSVT